MDASDRSEISAQTIRVFVSSTFRDMHAERDAINRLVFPELRRRCLFRGAEFIGVDMRWGVTEDEIQREGTLAICLHEIERSRPFFVCLLAERFGSVYPPEEVSPALVEAARAVPVLQSIVDQRYRLDETVAPPVYRLHRALGPTMADEEAAALVRFWEAHGLTGAGDSLTAREILRGVFEDGYPPTRALFYLRTAGVTRDAGFPPSLMPVFVETDEARRARLDALKGRIHGARDRLVVQDYEVHYAGLRLAPALIPADLPAEEQAVLSDIVTPAQWSQLSDRARDVLTQQGTVALSGMDTLAERMIDDLWQAIEPELARPARQLDAHERERAYHERFVTRHTAFFRGREAERARVFQYVGDTEDREVLVITGEPGAGKSAFMAECVRTCRERHPEALVIPHFIGAAPESASLPATLRSLCETLRREVGLEEAVAEDPDKLRFQLRTFLEQAGAKRPIILFLDALNQLDPAGRSHELDWLPMWAPPGTRAIVSTLEGDLLKQLTRRVPSDHVVTIPALPVNERRALVTDFLARRRKTLTSAQLNALLDVSQRPDAGLPLYTLAALEELCLFGDHAELITRIHRLPAKLPELFDQVLARVEQDHTRATVEAVCSWLAVARAGLLESEVLDLLGTGGAFPRIRWTRLYRTLEPYLKMIDEDAGDGAAGRLDFYHDQLRLAVFQRYLHVTPPDTTSTEEYCRAHRELATYFRSVAHDETPPAKWRVNRIRGLSELPFHQIESRGPLTSTLCSIAFIEAKCGEVSSRTPLTSGLGVFPLLADFEMALAVLAASAPWPAVSPEDADRIHRLRRHLWAKAAAVYRHPSILRQELWNALRWDNPPDHSLLAQIDSSDPPRVDRLIQLLPHSHQVGLTHLIGEGTTHALLIDPDHLLLSFEDGRWVIVDVDGVVLRSGIGPRLERLVCGRGVLGVNGRFVIAWSEFPDTSPTSRQLSSAVSICAAAMDAPEFVAASGDGRWMRLSLRNGTLVERSSGTVPGIVTVARMARDGERWLLGTSDGDLLSCTDMECRQVVSLGSAIRCVDIDHQSKRIAVGTQGGSVIWVNENGHAERSADLHSWVNDVSFNDQGDVLAALERGALVSVSSHTSPPTEWCAADAPLTDVAHLGRARALVRTSDGRVFVARPPDAVATAQPLPLRSEVICVEPFGVKRLAAADTFGNVGILELDAQDPVIDSWDNGQPLVTAAVHGHTLFTVGGELGAGSVTARPLPVGPHIARHGDAAPPSQRLWPPSLRSVLLRGVKYQLLRSVTGAGFSHGRDVVALVLNRTDGSGSIVQVWNTATWRCLNEFAVDRQVATVCVADAAVALVIQFADMMDAPERLQAEHLTSILPVDGARAIAADARAETVGAIDRHGVGWVYTVPGGKAQRLHDRVESIAVSADGSTVAFVTLDAELRVRGVSEVLDSTLQPTEFLTVLPWRASRTAIDATQHLVSVGGHGVVQCYRYGWGPLHT